MTLLQTAPGIQKGPEPAGPAGETQHGDPPTPPAAIHRILVVDDQIVEQKRISALLAARPGSRILIANNGREALRIVEREEIDVVLTDLQMPDIDGLGLVRQLRERRHGLPVVLMTSYGSEEIAIQALRAGATNYVAKRRLAEAIDEILGQVFTLSGQERKRQDLMGCLEERESLFRLENDQRLFSPLVDLLQDDLAATGFTDRTGRIQLGIALHEALANALYHGNLGLSSELRQFDDEEPFYEEARRRVHEEPYRHRRITVESHVTRQRARFRISDEGGGYDVARAAEPIEPDDLNRVGGKGLLLIKAFVTRVSFNALGNEITLEHDLAPPHA